MHTSITASVIYASLLWTSQAHMEMSNPLPIRSSFDPSVSEPMMDYNLKSPLNPDGSNFPCHGYQNERPIVSKATYVAGKQYSMGMAGTASHGGGSCQLSLSYDNGGTFKVIKSMIGGCPLSLNWDFTVPAYAPSGNALFAWTWFNEIGNREMYMNCAWVTIQGSSAARRKAKRQSTYTSMSSLPNIWKANIAGISSCATTEGTDPVFANPGPDVVYGGALSKSSPVTNPSGNCDSATPQGQTFQGLGYTGTGAAAVVPSVPSVSVPAVPSVPVPSVAAPRVPGVFAEGDNGASSSPSSPPPPAASSPSPDTPAPASSPVAAAAPVPVASPAAASPAATSPQDGTPSAAASASASTPVAADSRTVLPATTMTTTTAAAMAAATAVASADPISPAADSAAASLATAGRGTDVPTALLVSFASDSDIKSYLPCVPGSFLCISATQFRICDQSAVGIPFTPVMQYVSLTTVAAGMKCMPYLAPLPNTDAVTRMSNSSAAANVPNGFFRSDRYVLA